MQLSSLVIKVTSKCNLNCTYCYVFNKGDKSFIKEPAVMPQNIVNDLLEKIKNHCCNKGVDNFLIIFHGGEPLLVKKEFYIHFIEAAKRIAPAIKFDYALQTNGVLLNENWITLLDELKIQIGISLDGTEKANLERIYRKNNTCAYPDIVKGVNNLKEYSRQEVHLLSVVNTSEEPLNVYNHFKKMNVSSVTFLYPDMNYIHFENGDNIPQIGNWMISFFKIWNNDKNKREIIFHPFDIISQKILGYSKLGNETLGRRVNNVLTIKSNGNIEAVDSLKICGNRFTSTTFNVKTTEFDQVFTHHLINKYYYAHFDKYLCNKCVKCNLVEICGGGQLAHRYSPKNKFDNPSIYCKELKKLYIFLQNRLFEQLPEELILSSKIKKLIYENEK